MDTYSLCIKVKDGEVEGILNRLEKAQEEIYKCYNDLRRLGVLTVEKEEAASGN